MFSNSFSQYYKFQFHTTGKYVWHSGRSAELKCGFYFWWIHFFSQTIFWFLIIYSNKFTFFIEQKKFNDQDSKRGQQDMVGGLRNFQQNLFTSHMYHIQIWGLCSLKLTDTWVQCWLKQCLWSSVRDLEPRGSKTIWSHGSGSVIINFGLYTQYLKHFKSWRFQPISIFILTKMDNLFYHL